MILKTDSKNRAIKRRARIERPGDVCSVYAIVVRTRRRFMSRAAESRSGWELERLLQRARRLGAQP